MTRLGEFMTELPMNDAHMAKMLVASPEFDISSEILSIAAMLSVPNCFVRLSEDEIATDEARACFAQGDGVISCC